MELAVLSPSLALGEVSFSGSGRTRPPELLLSVGYPW